jgi:thiamine-phosphate pyrophosphorylase
MSRGRASPEQRSDARRAIGGLYAVTPDEPDTGILARKVRQALEGGARLLQYRNKTIDARMRRRQAATLLGLCREAGVPLIINDDLALALELGADGVHLGRGDTPIAEARSTLSPDRIVGVSCYASLERARDANRAGATYVAFGSAFPSTTKPGASHAPLSLYREARDTRLGCPVVAIGGITARNAGVLVEAGAAAVAVIADLFEAPNIAQRAQEFARLFESRNATPGMQSSHRDPP